MIEVGEIVVVKSLFIKEKHIMVFQMAADGLTRDEMADKLGVSVRTVEGYFNKVKDMLGCPTSIAAVAVLMRRKMIN